MDKQNLYLVMDYLQGGDLRFHISQRRKFTEAETSKILHIKISVLRCLHSFISPVYT